MLCSSRGLVDLEPYSQLDVTYLKYYLNKTLVFVTGPIGYLSATSHALASRTAQIWSQWESAGEQNSVYGYLLLSNLFIVVFWLAMANFNQILITVNHVLQYELVWKKITYRL